MFSVVKRFSLASPSALGRSLLLSRSLLGSATLSGTNAKSPRETVRRDLRTRVSIGFTASGVGWSSALVVHWSGDSMGWDLAGPKFDQRSLTGFRRSCHAFWGPRAAPATARGTWPLGATLTSHSPPATASAAVAPAAAGFGRGLGVLHHLERLAPPG